MTDAHSRPEQILDVGLTDRLSVPERKRTSEMGLSGNDTTYLQSAQYASKELLGPWFPEVDPKHPRAKTVKAWWSRRKTVLVTASITATVVFIVNVVGTTVVHLRYKDSHLFKGDCTTAARLDSGIHILINILSTLLLGASNLCMQLLSAPTRGEVDQAHAQQKWLDIGIHSMRNLPHIAWERQAVWIILALASLPLHVL